MTNKKGLKLIPGDKVVCTFANSTYEHNYYLYPMIIEGVNLKYSGEPVFKIVNNPHNNDFHCMWLENCSDVMFEVYKIIKGL